MYDHHDRTKFSLSENQKAVCKRAKITLTGTIVEAGENEAGSYVKFEIDERWGFPYERFVLDREALEIIETQED